MSFILEVSESEMTLFMTFGMCLSIFMLDKRFNIQSKVTQINYYQLPFSGRAIVRTDGTLIPKLTLNSGSDSSICHPDVK